MKYRVVFSANFAFILFWWHEISTTRLVNDTEPNGLSLFLRIRGILKQGLGQIFIASNSSRFFNKTDFEQHLFGRSITSDANRQRNNRVGLFRIFQKQGKYLRRSREEIFSVVCYWTPAVQQTAWRSKNRVLRPQDDGIIQNNTNNFRSTSATTRHK